MLATWEELHQQEAHRWRRPFDRVVKFTDVLRRHGAGRVLDVGCGAGRHVVFLARQGFQAYGVDNSPTGLTHARAWVEREGLEAEFRRSEMTVLPYRDGFFDGVVCVFTVYHGTLAEVRKAVSEIRRVLRPGGAALIMFKAPESHRFGQGRQVEPNTFIHDHGPDAGVLHHYSDREEVAGLLAGFAVQRVTYMEQGPQDQLHAWWVAEVARPEGDL